MNRMKPAELREIQTKLGEPLAVFTPDSFRLGVGIFACIVFLAIGLGLEYGYITSNDWKNGFNWFYGLVLVTFGLGILRWLLKIIGLKVLVYPEALLIMRRTKTQLFLWEDIKQVRQQQGSMIEVTHRDGTKLEYSHDTLKYGGRLTKMIRAEADKRGIPWKG